MVLNKRISFIRKISLSLFIFSLLSLLGSLWLQNTLAEFKFRKDFFDEKVNIKGIFQKKIDCSKNKELCFFSSFPLSYGFAELHQRKI